MLHRRRGPSAAQDTGLRPPACPGARHRCWPLAAPARRGSSPPSLRPAAAGGQLSQRRRAPALQGGLQHGGLPRQLQRQGGLPAQPPRRRPGLRLPVADPRRAGPPHQPAAPERSLVLLKPTGQVPHEGGIRFAAELARGRTSFATGSPPGRATMSAAAPRLKSLRVYPARADPAGRRSRGRSFGSRPSSTTARRATSPDRPPSTSAIRRWPRSPPTGLVRARRPGELTVAVRYLRGRGVSRLPSSPTGPASSGEARRRSTRSTPCLRQAPERCGSTPRRRPPIRSSSAAPISTPSAACPTADEARALPGRPRPGQAVQADRPPARPPRVRRLLGPEVGRPAPERREDDGRKGVWVFQRWLRDQIAGDVPLDEMVRRIVAARGSTWTNPAVELPPDQPRPDDRGRDRRPGLPGHPPPVRPLPQPPVRRSGPRTTITAWPPTSRNVERKEINNLRRDKLDKHEINGDEVIYLAGSPPAWSSPGPAPRWRPTPLHGRPRRPEATSRRARRPGRLADPGQPPVRPEPGQPRLVPPDGPGDRRAGRRLPRLESAVRTLPCSTR